MLAVRAIFFVIGIACAILTTKAHDYQIVIFGCLTFCFMYIAIIGVPKKYTE